MDWSGSVGQILPYESSNLIIKSGFSRLINEKDANWRPGLKNRISYSFSFELSEFVFADSEFVFTGSSFFSDSFPLDDRLKDPEAERWSVE